MPSKRVAGVNMAAALLAVASADLPGGGPPPLMRGRPMGPELVRQRDVDRARRAATAIPKAEAKRERKKAKRRALFSVLHPSVENK